MIELKFRNCGGKLSVQEPKVFVGDGLAVVRRGWTLRCEHCDTEYLPGDDLPLSTTVNIQVNQQIESVGSGGTVIGVQLDLGKAKQ